MSAISAGDSEASAVRFHGRIKLCSVASRLIERKLVANQEDAVHDHRKEGRPSCGGERFRPG